MSENSQPQEAEPSPPVPAPPPAKARIRPELVISLFSLSLSLVAATTNLFQARLQRDQQETSVWPYVECAASISQDGFAFTVSNKGVGPAIVRSERYRYQGRDYPSMVDLVKALGGMSELDYATFQTTPVAKRVLSPQESVLVFKIQSPKMAELAISKVDEVEVFIEFESVYGKKWVCQKDQVVPVE